MRRAAFVNYNVSSQYLAKLKQKWWKQNSECGTLVGDGPTISYQSELSLSDLSGIFFILVVGLIGKF